MFVVKGRLFVAEDFDDAAVLGPDVDAVGFEVEEVGAGWGALGGRVPPVGLIADIALVVDAATSAVVDDEFVVLKAVVLYQSADDKAVVVAVAVGCDDVGVG